ncbi:efflux RND transporter permease subunit [Frigoriglobus tundricola]|uniref:CzcABC family efflux RND transporter, transmembrane protein n=1 Tax=Frigoriglobus tundricola TaxID=2774151 RepID=A0A6M5YKV6_9BACT|nr:efflux RND transporter permease subunit [Frigoriglobus tundricola]QJW93913.1 CzcABC family efflux RND transporter, transmembrane protein [Frigoriglobus tundricola]
MNPIVFAMRYPYAVMVGVVAVLIGSGLAATRLHADVFPPLNQPVVYICQPYGGMSPDQMEGLLTNYYEFHLLYVNAVHHVESRNVTGMTLIKVFFHPGTDMGQATAELVAAVNRARFMMPPGTVPPFVARTDTGTAPVGFLVLKSDTRSIKDIQDIATLRVRPQFANIPGVSSPPAFGGNQRAIVVNVNPDAVTKQGLTLWQVTEAVSAGNPVTPSGTLKVGDRQFLVTSNAMVGAKPAQELAQVPVKPGPHPVLLGDVATIEDSADLTAGYALVNGRRSVYMLITKRADASTVTVVNDLKAALPRMRTSVPEDVDITFEFDQSPIVTEAMWGVGTEGLIGALLTGLMVLLFLRDWRSVIVVVLNIPLALAAAAFALWASGQTLNLMTLGGLALAVGILVDEATVEVENIHTQLLKFDNVARAVRTGNSETAVPRLLAMLCILAVFVPSFFMEGAARELFVPLSLAVGYSMIASYVLSSTFVPVLSVWLLRPGHPHADAKGGLFGKLMDAYEAVVARIVYRKGLVAPGYLIAALALAALLYLNLGTAIFPPTDKGQFLLRLKAPTGTRIERTEELAQEATRLIKEEAGAGNVEATVGYIGMFPTNYPIQAIHQWTSGPGECLLKVALRESSGLRVEEQKEKLRTKLDTGLKAWLAARWKEDGLPRVEIDARLPGLRLSFEPGDLVSDVMSFGAPTPVEVQVSGSDMAANLAFATALRDRLVTIPDLRDVQLNPAQDYPTISLTIDRARAATMNVTARDVGLSLVPATASSRYMQPIYWRDPKNGQAYIVQVQVPPPQIGSIMALGNIPVGQKVVAEAGASGGSGNGTGSGGEPPGVVLLRDTLAPSGGAMPGTTAEEIYRYNMRRAVSITANVATQDLGKVRAAVQRAIADSGEPARGVQVDVRGQLNTLNLVQTSLGRGLLLAILAIALLLTAYFQSIRLALVSVAAVPATLCGVGLTLWATGTTLNLQSFMGAIMALGVSVANAILLVTFAERARLLHGGAVRAAVEGGRSRLRPILMTSCAMVAGMLPMAIGASAGGDQTAPLGRAVVGGLTASTLTTLFILPAVFAVVQRRASVAGASLDPDDPNSGRYDENRVKLFDE